MIEPQPRRSSVRDIERQDRASFRSRISRRRSARSADGPEDGSRADGLNRTIGELQAQAMDAVTGEHAAIEVDSMESLDRLDRLMLLKAKAEDLDNRRANREHLDSMRRLRIRMGYAAFVVVIASFCLATALTISATLDLVPGGWLVLSGLGNLGGAGLFAWTWKRAVTEVALESADGSVEGEGFDQASLDSTDEGSTVG